MRNWLIRKHFKDNKYKRYAAIVDNRSTVRFVILGPYRDKYDKRIKIASRSLSSKYIKRAVNKKVRKYNLLLNHSDYRKVSSYWNELI